MEKGLIPDDLQLVGEMVKDICYFNARRYFEFPDLASNMHGSAGAAVPKAASLR
jgi:hypothetical protein